MGVPRSSTALRRRVLDFGDGQCGDDAHLERRDELSALGGTRTPNLLIRSPDRYVHHHPWKPLTCGNTREPVRHRSPFTSKVHAVVGQLVGQPEAGRAAPVGPVRSTAFPAARNSTLPPAGPLLTTSRALPWNPSPGVQGG